MEVAGARGVIAGIVPSTNPTSTTIYKSLISPKSGNAIVFTPHPSARKCIAKTVEIIQGALRSCNVSPDMVSCITIPTIEGTNELMKICDLILATGGPGMVKAAYSSGTPALGVGAGNTPAFIERTADIESAVTTIMSSKTFDNGTICASEQSIVTESCIAAKVRATPGATGGFRFLQGEKLEKVKNVMERGNGSMNPAIVGRDALTIARIAGIDVPQGTRLLVSDEKGVGHKYPFSKENSRPCSAFLCRRSAASANCARPCAQLRRCTHPAIHSSTKKSSANSASGRQACFAHHGQHARHAGRGGPQHRAVPLVHPGLRGRWRQRHLRQRHAHEPDQHSPCGL